jgi:hypothetical protein
VIPANSRLPRGPLFSQTWSQAFGRVDLFLPAFPRSRPSRPPDPTGRTRSNTTATWTDRYPAIAAVAAKLRAKSFTLDSEAAVSGADGVAVFEALYRRRAAPDAILRAFDLLERCWRGCWPDEDGPIVFECACKFGLEGIVSKRIAAPYRSGLSRDWIRVKNPNSPAMQRAREGAAVSASTKKKAPQNARPR